ncbi:MAG TPA: glycosyltransferase family 39 protein, partial [Ardenticatenaceae bacterium]|nr:glycosyltransferase family 39 protein [Ardenticatenaceae bacterium]
PLYKYLLLGEYIVTYGLGRVAGVYASAQAFADDFRADPTLLYLIARATSAVLGALTVLATYGLAHAARGRSVALLAAWLATVAYLLVRESHFAVNDALVTLMTTMALLFCARIAATGRRADSFAAGALTGLAFAAKYTGAAVLAPFILAHVLSPGQRKLGNLALGLVAALAASLIAFPPLLLEPGRVAGDIYTHLYLSGRNGYDGMDPAGGYVYYLKVLVVGLGWPLLLAAGAGLVHSAVRRDQRLLVIAALPVALYAFMGQQRMYFARFILPALPPLLVLAATVSDAGVARLLQRVNRPGLAAAVVAITGVLLGARPALDAVRFDRLLAREDTRTQARAWIEAHIPAGTRIAVDWFPFGPPLSPDRHDLLVADGWALFDLTIEEYRQQGINYLVASSYTYDLPLRDPQSDRRRQAFYTAMREEALLIEEFRPYAGEADGGFVYDRIYAPFDHLGALERPGPTVRIYQLPSGAALR